MRRGSGCIEAAPTNRSIGWRAPRTSVTPRRLSDSSTIAARAATLKAGNSEFARRRRQLTRIMGRGSIAILPAAPVRIRNNDVEHPFRQDSDFYYLTGLGEPEAVAVLVAGRERSEER